MIARLRRVACALLFAVAAACTRTDAPAPVAGVRFAIAADPQTLDPLFAHADANSVEQQLARLAFEPFIDIDAHGHPIPVLLARIPTVANGDLSRDGRTIVYHLRRGVRWQDGVPVTAADVLFTLHAIVDPRNPVASREGYDRVARAERIDDATVRVVLKAPWAPAVSRRCSATAPHRSTFCRPTYWRMKHGSIARHSVPLRSAMVRIASSRGNAASVSNTRRTRRIGAAPPASSKLEIRVVADPGANFTALESGALDWNLISPVQQQAMLGRAGISFRYVPLALVAGVAFNTAHPPLDDVRVRRAIAASIDRQAISDKITFKRYPVVDTAQPLGSWARRPVGAIAGVFAGRGGRAARCGRLEARRGRHAREERHASCIDVRAVSRKARPACARRRSSNASCTRAASISR